MRSQSFYRNALDNMHMLPRAQKWVLIPNTGLALGAMAGHVSPYSICPLADRVIAMPRACVPACRIFPIRAALVLSWRAARLRIAR